MTTENPDVVPLHAEPIDQAAPDPFDPASLAISGDMAAELGVKKLLVSVPVRKPGRQEFFRVDPRSDYQMNAAVLELKDEREIYLGKDIGQRAKRSRRIHGDAGLHSQLPNALHRPV